MQTCRHAYVLAGGTAWAAPHVVASEGMAETQRAVQSRDENQPLFTRGGLFFV